MRAADIFDVVLDRVRECQALAARISAIRPDACAKGGPPQVGNALAEYVAEFEIVGRRVLRRWPRRLQAFRAYYVDGGEYGRVIEELKVRPGTFDWWCAEIKRAVGKELARAGLFPPRRYRERNCDDELYDQTPE